ncbi:phosphodiester glycosidase family protein [Patescibacteria group bacterium]
MKLASSRLIILFILALVGVLVLSSDAKAGTNSGYEELNVSTASGTFFIRSVRINLTNPNLQIYSLTGTSGDCTTCSVYPLRSYVDQVNGFAAINGSYFCPADYSSCAGGEGSYFWMWYHSLTRQFTNSYKNQFNGEEGAAIAFDTNNNFYLYKHANDWPGKTASVSGFENQTGATLQAAISNGPTLVYEGKLVVRQFYMDSKQLSVKSNRSGIGFKGGSMYLIVANGATVPDLANVMMALNMDHAVNLDGGGSSSLFYDGQYKAGPGRNLPNALVFAETQEVAAVAPASQSFFTYDPKLRGGYQVSTGNVRGDAREEIIFGTDDGLGPHVRIYNYLGKLKNDFFAFDRNLRNGVTVSACDVNNDGYDEIVTAQGRGGWPIARIYTWEGKLLSEFTVLDGRFLGGINLSCGDTDGNGKAEIVVAARQGGGAHVLVYDINGKAAVNFFAYDPSFRGGINVTTIDMNGDGADEIVTGPHFGAPHVQIFQIKPNEVKRVSPGFYAFDSGYRGGVDVDGVDVDGDGQKEILVSRGIEATPLVKVFNNKEILQKNFFAFGTNFTGGVNIAGGDVDGDSVDEVVVVPRSNGGPQVRVIDVSQL